MTLRKRERETLLRNGRTSSIEMDAIDAQWREHHRHIFHICAERLSPSDDLAHFAISVAEPAELCGLVDRVLDQQEYLKLPADAVAELESGRQDSQSRLRHVCHRVIRLSDALYPIIVDYVNGKGHVGLSRPPVPEIIEEVMEMFSLTSSHARILMALYAVEDVELMTNSIRQATHRTQMSLLADIANADLTTFVKETAPGARLERIGLIGYRAGRDEIADMNISRPLLFALRSGTLDDLKAGLFDETPSPSFALFEFSVSEEEARTCAAAVRGGLPLLIAGDSGVGKTEFVRALIDSLGRQAQTLATVNRHFDHHRGQRGNERESSRLAAIRMAANLLSPATDVLIVDEADAVLQSAVGFFGLSGGGSYDKARLNDLLEHLPVATVWITNDHRMIPSSALRRFGHVLAFPRPAVDTRARMLTERLASLSGCLVDASAHAWTRDLAARYDITPAAIDRATRIIATELRAQELPLSDVRDRIACYMEQTSTGALARDVRRLPTVAASFDPRFCTTSESLDRVERQVSHRVQSGSGLRLLFGGPPGGGKTQCALWLAKRLGRDVMLKRPSDLLSKYVGESEQQIAATFRAASQAGSVLILDEADALLYDRSIATRSWEHSQIAEFLQQIQEYTGVLIACTNRVDAVDPALRRRFHKHVTFGPIGEGVLKSALDHVFPSVDFSDSDLTTLRKGPPLMMSDLATAAEMMEIDDPSDEVVNDEAGRARGVVEEILANARARDCTRKIGF